MVSNFIMSIKQNLDSMFQINDSFGKNFDLNVIERSLFPYQTLYKEGNQMLKQAKYQKNTSLPIISSISKY